jgi:hypothetical protein
MSLHCATGSVATELTSHQLQDLLVESLSKLGKRSRVLVVPPDQSRVHSRAGDLTRYAWGVLWRQAPGSFACPGHAYRHAAEADHPNVWSDADRPFPRPQLANGCRDPRRSPGEVHPRAIGRQAELCVACSGQPPHCKWRFRPHPFHRPSRAHEVIGMANYNKNILVGTGGRDSINRSHYLGAVYGMERIMGR